MEVPNDFYRRVVAEWLSYAPVVLPTLLVYALETRASLNLWHAVQQLPHLEKEAAADDTEASVDAAHQAEVVATQKSTKKAYLRETLGRLSVIVMFAAIFLFEQYVTVTGRLVRAREDDDPEDYVVFDPDERQPEPMEGYNWYYDSTYGKINWSKFYHVCTLFLPAVLLIARTLHFLFRLKVRAVLRNTKAMPFMLATRSSLYQINRRASVMTSIALVALSIFIAYSALWNLSFTGPMVLFGSLIHYMVSGGLNPKAASFKNQFYSGLLILSMPVVIFYNFYTLEEDKALPFRLYFAPPSTDRDWSALIYTALLCTGSFNIISLCYRMDHAIAFPNQLITGLESVQIKVHHASEVTGTCVSYMFGRVPQFKTPYFHTAIWSWLASYGVVAAIKVLGFIDCKAESAGVFVLYIAPPLMCSAVLLRSVTRGEVKKVWQYNENWMRNPVSDEQGGGLTVGEAPLHEVDAKPLMAEENEKVVLQA